MKTIAVTLTLAMSAIAASATYTPAYALCNMSGSCSPSAAGVANTEPPKPAYYTPKYKGTTAKPKTSKR